jgi:hypothetical protein
MPTKTARSIPNRSAVTLPHRIHALLHTVRTIAHFEDELCTLLHAAEHAKASSPELCKELRALLTRMPANEYLYDLEAVRGAIDISALRRPQAAKQLSSKSHRVARSNAASARTKAAARPKARKAKS